MTDHNVTDEKLNAYVDGELPPDARARIAASIAQDPVLAARVAVLAQLKTAVADSAGAPPRSLRHTDDTVWWRMSPIRYAATAAVVMLAIAASVSLIVSNSTPVANTYVNAWLMHGIGQHAAWIAQPLQANRRTPDAEFLLAAVDALDQPLHVPEMRSAKLRLTGVRYVAPGAERNSAGIHLKYTGNRGCRVTLWIARAPDELPTTLTPYAVGAQRGYYWRVDKTGYAIFAAGMAPKRFDLLARNTFRATRERQRPPADWRNELRIASNAAPPCAA